MATNHINATNEVGDFLKEHGGDMNFFLGNLTGDMEDDSVITMPLSKFSDEADLISHLKTKSDQFIVFSLNIRSLASKHNYLQIFINSLKLAGIRISAICLQECFFQRITDTESVQLENDDSTDLIQLKDYELIPQGSSVGRKGGLAIYLHESFRFKPRRPLSCHEEDWEMQFIDIFGDSLKKTITLGNIYRPPRNSADQIDGFIKAVESTIRKMGTPAKYQILAGDFNLNLLKFSESERIGTFFDMLVSQDFAPLITLPTRMADTGTCTLIDNIFFRSPPGLPTPIQHITSRILTSSFSDHLACVISLDIMHKAHTLPKSVSRRNFTETNISKFCDDFEGSNIMTDIGPELNKNPNDTYEIFHQKLSTIRDKYMPLKTEKFNRNKHKIQDWVTPAIMRSAAKKNRLYAAFKKEKIGSSAREKKKEKFKEYESVLNQVIRRAKTEYYREKFDSYVNNIKGTWNEIKKLLNKNRKVSKYPKTFIRDGVEYSDPKSIADSFNSFFTGIGPKLAQSINTDGKPSHVSYLGESHHTLNFDFNFTNSSRILKIIKNFKAKGSSGDDEVTSIFLKHERVSHLFAPCLSILINQSLHTGIFPDRLKIAKVVPLFKDKGDDFDFENYRPISLLSVISKVYERVAYDQLYDFFDSNDLFYKSQYGFRKGHSTEHALLELYDRVLRNVDKQHDPFAIFLDLSKAFDTIDHAILISKLNHYGIRGSALNWFKSYLSNRCQYVTFEGINSDHQKLTTGVPQGSILGPLLFIIYINDLSNASTLFDAICFADDSNLITSLHDVVQATPAGGSVTRTTNEELAKVSDWMAVNKLSLNASKTRLMVFNYKRRNEPATINSLPVPDEPETDYRLYLNGKKIEKVVEFNFLGVIINQNLTWTSHIGKLATKIGKTIGILTRLKRFLPTSILKMLYNSLILSMLNYGNLAWGFNMGRLIILQKKAIRAIFRTKYNAHTEPYFKVHKMLKLSDIFTLRCLKFYFKLVNRTLPPYFYEMLPTAGEVHGINTRQAAAGELHQQRSSRTLGAHQCIRNKILDDITSYDHQVLDKLTTHSFQGFSEYAKNFIIASYNMECQNGPTCNTCHRAVERAPQT